MRTFIRSATLASVALGLALASAPVANSASVSTLTTQTGVTVRLAVQGPNGTVFSGPVMTTGHDVTTASGGTHKCDGTNNGAYPTPGPTPTAALDDAAKAHGFTWDGVWYPSFDDYLVTTIAGYSGSSTAYWNISVNGTSIPVGGCQFRIKAGDKVAFTWTNL